MPYSKTWEIMQKSYDWIMSQICHAKQNGENTISFSFEEWHQAVAADVEPYVWDRAVAYADDPLRRILSHKLNCARLHISHSGSRFSTPIGEHRWTIRAI